MTHPGESPTSEDRDGDVYAWENSRTSPSTDTTRVCTGLGGHWGLGSRLWNRERWEGRALEQGLPVRADGGAESDAARCDDGDAAAAEPEAASARLSARGVHDGHRGRPLDRVLAARVGRGQYDHAHRRPGHRRHAWAAAASGRLRGRDRPVGTTEGAEKRGPREEDAWPGSAA